MSSEIKPILVDLTMSDGEIEFDIDEAVARLALPVLLEKGDVDFVPRKAGPLKGSIRRVAMNYRHDRGEENTKDDMDNVKLWIYGAYSLEEMTWEINQLFNIKGVLALISDPLTKFPQEFQEIAEALTKKFSAQWVKPVEPAKAMTPRRKRQKLETSPYFADAGPVRASPAVAAEEPTLALSVKAPKAHPIYGDEGIMRNISVQKGATVSYKIDPLFKVDFRTFGNNKLPVGQWWPMLVAACRDGAHGHRMAGISGTADEGAYSVVVAGAYSDVDVDSGDELLYSAPKSHETKDPEPDLSNQGTKVLLRSAETRKPIRVLRQSSGHWEGRPRVGLRYDGLYIIYEHTRKTNGHGGGFIQFRLRRCGNQEPIDRSRPTQEEKELFRKVKERF